MEEINFYLVHMTILIIAEFVWSFFIVFVIFKLFRRNDLILSKKFFIFVIVASLSSVLINRFFEFAISDIDIIEGIWVGLGRYQKIGLLIVPASILMYAYFYLASLTFKLKVKELLILVLVLGIANSPWRILL